MFLHFIECINNFSLLKKSVCEMEKPLAPCCAKMGLKKKNNCCEHKFFFAKLKTEFTSEKIHLNPNCVELISIKYIALFPLIVLHKIILEQHYSGLPPPKNITSIKATLKPTPQKLMIYLC